MITQNYGLSRDKQPLLDSTKHIERAIEHVMSEYTIHERRLACEVKTGEKDAERN